MVKKSSRKKEPYFKKWRPTPLKGSFMAMAILGILISAYYVYPKISQDFGIAFMLVFAAMFVASLISMTKAPVVEP